MVYNIDTSHVDNRPAEETGEKRSWKQYCLTFIAYIPFLSSSLQFTYLSSFKYEPPWTNAVYLACTIVSGPISCWLADKYGRTKIAVALSILQIISWVPILCSVDFAIRLTSKILLGIATGAIYTIQPIYVLEISNKKTRGICVTSLMVMASLGQLVMRSMINRCDDMMKDYVLLGALIVQFLGSFLLIESPSYLVMLGDEKKAAQSYAKLKSLHPESLLVRKKIEELTREFENAKCKDGHSIYRILKNEIWRDGFKIGLILFTLMPLGGRQIFLDHVSVLAKPGVDFDPELWSLGVPALMVASGVVTMAFVDIWERRNHLCLSFSVLTVSLGLLGLYMQEDMEATSVPAVPTTCLLLVILAYGLVWGLPYLVANEICTFKVRAVLIATLYAYSQTLDLLHYLTLPYIEDYMGTYTLVYIFSAINLFGAIYCYFRLPALKNKSTKQIEKELKRKPII